MCGKRSRFVSRRHRPGLFTRNAEEERVLGRTRRSQHPSKGYKLAEQQEQKVGKETKGNRGERELAAIPADEFLCMRTLSAALSLLDARPARAGVHLGGRLLVLPWTPVSPDEFFVAGDAGPRVGVRRASCCGILRTHVFERRQHLPLRSVVRRHSIAIHQGWKEL